MNLHIQYLTDEKGTKIAVQIPFKEWLEFLTDYNHLKQYVELKKGLADAFQEVHDIEQGKTFPITLEEFLNEC